MGAGFQIGIAAVLAAKGNAGYGAVLVFRQGLLHEGGNREARQLREDLGQWLKRWLRTVLEAINSKAAKAKVVLAACAAPIADLREQ
jgi:hypothetical protein